ncbi:phytolongin Phyl2.2 [Diospyros lotus]|uniref:phytolongin Phyl2.2 n=1 Tax=Diospyros lotus TaxID=55363 RepID=UPI00224EDF59|nr:phytolongin Phyl2.2 [Diospyros lotus]
MISNPNLILYACVSKGTTILAEFNCRDADLADLASRCLEKAPQFHATFSHTVRKRTFTFLLDDPLIYFTIYDDALETSEALCFLRSVRDAFREIRVKSAGDLSSHSFQGEFNPVFHQLLTPAPATEMESPPDAPKHGHAGSFSVPLLSGDSTSKCLVMIKKKKKKRLFGVDANGESKDGLAENKVDVCDDNGVILSRDFSKSGLFVNDSPHQKAKHVWKKHVWVVLSLDLIVCFILFAIWLWICRGFKCIDG